MQLQQLATVVTHNSFRVLSPFVFSTIGTEQTTRKNAKSVFMWKVKIVKGAIYSHRTVNGMHNSLSWAYWELRWTSHKVCDAWSVRRQTCGYLPSFAASPVTEACVSSGPGP